MVSAEGDGTTDLRMRKYLVFIFLVLLASGCRKDREPPLSGSFTIDNNLYGTGPYYAFGFSFSKASKVSTLENPPPDITLIAITDIFGHVTKMNLQTSNFKGSFFKAGQYTDAAEALQAFDNLTSATVSQWADDADDIAAHQVWIFRSRSENYAKFLITDAYSEDKDVWPYAECTFKWAYQPDGTLTFPGK